MMPTTLIRFCLVFFVLLLIGVASVAAQPGEAGIRTEPNPPSRTGGTVGSPGAGGQAVNAGFSAPSREVPEANRTAPERPNAPGAERNTPERPQRELPFQQDNDFAGASGTFSDGRAGFSSRAANDGASGLQSLFGERGTATIGLPFLVNAEGQVNFGNLTDPQTSEEATSLLQRFESEEILGFSGFGVDLANGETAPDEETLPEAPTPLDDLDAVVATYQQQVDDNLAAANDQVTQTREDTMNTMTAVYDDLWADYYAAVDYTAQVYYDTVTSSVDYAAQAYADAVVLTTDTIDYYLDYAAAYADYCVIYPWDCYSYTYIETTNEYIYTGDLSTQPVAYITLATPNFNPAVLSAIAPQPSAEAYEALVRLANDQLGAAVQPLYAGELTVDVLGQIDQLPDAMVNLLLLLTQTSAESYYGLLNGGVGSVLLGDCTPDERCDLDAAQFESNLTTNASGLYSFNISEPLPTSPETALAQLFRVFPKLEGLSFAQITNLDGYHFAAVTAGLGVDTNGSTVSVAKAVHIGVFDVDGKTVAYALVALGDTYVQLITGSM